MKNQSLAFVGSRSLQAAAAPQVRGIVGAALRSGWLLRVGCCTGADQLVIAAVLAAGAGERLHISAAFDSQGAGRVAVSAVSTVQLAAHAGVSISWLAGGPLRLPVKARLARRSSAVSAGAAGCLALLAAPQSAGSLLAAAHVARAGRPVWAWSLDFIGRPDPLPGLAGSWQRSVFFGLPCWSWHPGQAQLLQLTHS